ncbi:hypothetical protein CVT26_002306 [Gymnopilus dilepis]|uniref:Uncharacterized protein n=1 Tax=Gymnopilus dilepis TaxID=231916 RepID=A0A409Y3L8_9AGAR|nr:hypothetical protein CVT26_002306 [Gymnopilus dilepis]
MYSHQRPPMATYAPPYQPYHYSQQQQQPPQRSYPTAPNWSAGPPPFQGAPPIPPGISVNPQAWNAGVWQYNPAYKQSGNPQQQQHVPWIPSHHWMPQQRPPAQPPNVPPKHGPPAQPANQPAPYNPYKRQSRDGSAEYYANQLSDNPLGLFNMKPATVEEYYRRGHETPWIWKPRDLDDDPDDPTSGGGAQKQESFTEKIELQPTFSSKIIRTPEHYRNTNGDSTSSPNRTPSRTSKSSLDSQLSTRMSQMSIGSSSSTSSTTLSRQSSLPLSSSSSFSSLYSASPTKPEFGSTTAPGPVLADHFSDEPDSILSPLVLSNTPLPAPPKNLRSVRNNHPNPLLATQSLDTIPEAPASRLGIGIGSSNGSTTPQQQTGGGNGNANGNALGHQSPPLHHANTMPNPPKSQLSYPPQMPPFPPPQPLPYKSRDREKEREAERESQRERDHRERERDREKLGTKYTTYVDPHISSSTPSPRNSIPSSSRPSPSSGPSSSHASPSPIRPPSTNVTPPSNTYPTSPPPSGGMMSSPPPHGPLPHPIRHSPPSRSNSGSTSTLSNPLPPPPRLVQRPPILPVQRTSPPVYREKLRKGFWNKRGDHLTADGYIVYAPKDKAYPDELRTYPEPEEGYQDHNRVFTAWIERPELPQSLPRRGEPPECPYEAFVVYEYKV